MTTPGRNKQKETDAMGPREKSELSQIRASRTLTFIYHQLIELVIDCEAILNDSVQPEHFLELETRLDKLLYETRSAHKPPLMKLTQDDFVVVKQFASGTFGSVSLVRHKQTGQRFAMKAIRRDRLVKAHQVNQVLLERDILTYVDNPFVVKMFCSYETPSDLCMVMEYVGGGDCGSLLQHFRCFPVKMAQAYIAETIVALEGLHSYGIIHKDVKPANMLITLTGHIKLTDFGLSRIGPVDMTFLRDESQRRAVAYEITDSLNEGTPLYAAPEMIMGNSFGKPVDWWALGAVLYEFLVGVPTFDGDTCEEVYQNIVRCDVEWPEHCAVPEDAKNLVSMLLIKDPEQRLGTGGAAEIRAHPFFISVRWDSLLSGNGIFVPSLWSEEDTHNFCSYSDNDSVNVTEEDADKVHTPVPIPDFHSIAFHFNKVYCSPTEASRKPSAGGRQEDEGLPESKAKAKAEHPPAQGRKVGQKRARSEGRGQVCRRPGGGRSEQQQRSSSLRDWFSHLLRKFKDFDLV